MNACTTTDLLRPQHKEHLMRFRIPPEIIEAANVRSLSDAETRETFGVQGHDGEDLGGILFPYIHPLTGVRVGGRIRLDHLLPDGSKYFSEAGCRHLFFAPFPKEWLTDTSIAVVLVESEKAALALHALAKRVGRKLIFIAVGGCWGWRRKIGKRVLPNGTSESKTGPAPDFDLIAWVGRTAILLFDSNASTNPKVKKARSAFYKELSARRSNVLIADVPAIENVNGPDDLIAVSSDEAIVSVLDSPSVNEPDVIILERGKLHAAVDQAEEILLGHSERLGIFQCAGELVRVIYLPIPHNGEGLQRSKGTVQLEPLGGLPLTEVFSRIIRWDQIDSKGDVQTVDCPPKIAAFYISRVGFWRLPVLAGIISSPLLREDGTVLSQPGFDKESGLFFVSDDNWSGIPDRPSRADAEAALKILRAPFEEFPFVADEDFAVQIAAILTAIQRRTLGACPIFGYSAPAQRSGKSLLAESVAIIATGKPAPATAVSGDREEIRKSITSALREGHIIVNLDNIEHPLASPDLARAVTQSEYQDRLLGESRMLRLSTNVLWTATGNNLVFRGDLSSRALLCRIDSGLERPEARTFKIRHLADHLKNNRKDLVTAALTILRAYHVAGRPRQEVQSWGGFNNWSASIREALVWLGVADPCKTRETVLADDPEREESLAALLALHEAFGEGQFTLKMVAERCVSDNALKNSILSVAAGRQQRHEVDSRRLGWWCRNRKDQVLGGLRLYLSGKASGVANWRIEVPSCGHRGHGGHFPAIGEKVEPMNPPAGGANNAERPGNDPYDHHDHQRSTDDRSDDEVVL
jgi:putative DNA primase/helicase